MNEFQRRFSSVLEEVAREGVFYVLTRDDHPEAVLIPYEVFLRYQRLQEEEVLARFIRLLTRMAEKNASYSEEEIQRDIRTALHEVRNPCAS